LSPTNIAEGDVMAMHAFKILLKSEEELCSAPYNFNKLGSQACLRNFFFLSKKGYSKGFELQVS